MSNSDCIFWWVRSDFRFLDNSAFFAAVKETKRTGKEFLPIAFLDRELLEDDWMNIGYARRAMLSRILSQFAAKFDKFLIVAGDVNQSWSIISENLKAEVHVNDDCEPFAVKRFAAVRKILSTAGDRLNVTPDYLTVNPETRTKEGNLYSVFGPFQRQVIDSFVTKSTFEKPDLSGVKYADPTSWQFLDKLDGFLVTGSEFQTFGNNPGIKLGSNLQQAIFELIDRPNIVYFGTNREWQKNPNTKEHQPTQSLNIDEIWERPKFEDWYDSEEGALAALSKFNDSGIQGYSEGRNYLNREATSQLSVALKWGLVSSRTITYQLQSKHGRADYDPNLTSYVSELVWREFYRYLLRHYPLLLDQEFQPKFRQMLWVDGTDGINRFAKWIQGRTGYPAVDAAMNEIAKSGWMHNRARMMVASILTKNLGIDWRWGQDYFRLMLLDLDEASNNGGWQWSGSVGADPKPIRIFNPYLQGTNWDKDGKYQSKWLPQDYYRSMPIVSESLFEKIFNGSTAASKSRNEQNSNAALFGSNINSRTISMVDLMANRSWQSLLDLIEPVVEHRAAREEALLRYGLGSIPKHAVRDF